MGVSDGAPLLKFENESVGGSVVSDVVLGDRVNGTEEIVAASGPGLDPRKRAAFAAMLSKYDDADALLYAMTEAAKSNSNAKRQVHWFNGEVVASGDDGLVGQWAHLLVGFVERGVELAPLVFDWAQVAVLSSGDPDLRARWADVLLACFEADPDMGGRPFGCLSELEGWQ